MNFERHVKVGDTVKIHFTGKLEDGTVFDSSQENKPLKFKVGSGSVIQGIDDTVVGMKANQEKSIHISSDKAYGSIEKELIISVDKNTLPKDLDLKLDQELQIPNEDGNSITVHVTQITDKLIELDGNHPLAGKNLIFDIRLVEIL